MGPVLSPQHNKLIIKIKNVGGIRNLASPRENFEWTRSCVFVYIVKGGAGGKGGGKSKTEGFPKWREEVCRGVNA